MNLLTIAIPAYNAESTLQRCLDSLFVSPSDIFEVLVIDDGSEDRTGEMASNYPVRLIRHPENRGRMVARNTALHAAKGDIILFVDSDIVLRPETVSRIKSAFIESPEIDAVSGILSPKHPNLDFFSQYKNLYMHFSYSSTPPDADIVYGGLFAVRKSSALPFNTNQHFCNQEDTEYGKKLAHHGKKIRLDRTIQVEHLHRYTLRTLLWAHFDVSAGLVDTFFRYKGIRGFLKKGGRYANAPINILASILLAPVTAAFFILALFGIVSFPACLILLSFHFVLNLKFIIFCARANGILFGLTSFFFCLPDHLTRFSGLMQGLMHKVLNLQTGHTPSR